MYMKLISRRKAREWGSDKDEPLDSEFFDLLELIERVKVERYGK